MGFPRTIALGLAALGGAAALSGCGSASGSPPLPAYAGTLCPVQPNGELCIKVLDQGLTKDVIVKDAIGYLAASDSPLAGMTWRLVLGRYVCDPGSAVRPRCSPSATYPGPTRRGRPPQQTSCRTESGKTVTAPTGCHNTLAQEFGSFGDWSGLTVPKRVASGTWFCVSEQIRVGSAWRQPRKALATYPVRACAIV
jgi:hypothetical protein